MTGSFNYAHTKKAVRVWLRLSNSDTSDSCYSLRKIRDYTSQLSRKRWGETFVKRNGKRMITRFLIVAGLVLSCSLCWAEDFPENTDEIKSLTVEQAADLVAENERVRYLALNGLISIDKDVAHELAKFSGYHLELGKLALIDNDVALELGKSKAQCLVLGLTSIDKDVAQELAKFKRDYVSLHGLTSVSKDIAQELAKSKAHALSLDGLTSIDKDVAQELAKFKGDDLYLRGLTSIDKDVAHELAKFQRRVLWLNGLTSIDKDVAQELAKVEGGLDLDGLTSVDKDVLKILKSNPNIILDKEYRD